MIPDLPPRLPRTLVELEWAVMNLGHLTKGDKLPKAAHAQMITLLGSCPGAKKAKAWKQSLKALAVEMRSLGVTIVDELEAERQDIEPEPPPVQAPTTTTRKRVIDVSSYRPRTRRPAALAR